MKLNGNNSENWMQSVNYKQYTVVLFGRWPLVRTVVGMGAVEVKLARDLEKTARGWFVR